MIYLQSKINLTTILQATAVKVKVILHRSMKIYSVYIPPYEWVNEAEIHEIRQLSAAFMVGEFNCHSTIWDCTDTNQIINNNNLCIYNDKTLPYINLFTGSYSDLSIWGPSIYMDFSWKVLVDTCSSDHLPIVLQNSEHNDKNELGQI